MRRDEEDRRRQRTEKDEVQRAVDRDQPQDDLVPERLAPKREHDLTAVRDMPASGLRRCPQRDPAVAAKAPMPAQPIVCPCDQGILGPQLRRIGADDLMTPHAADDQLPVELRAEARGLLDTSGRSSAPRRPLLIRTPFHA